MDWLNEYAWAVWLALSIGLGAAELASLDLVLAMLAVGAIAAMITALTGLGVIVQVLIGLATATAMLALVRPPLIHRLHEGPDLTLGHDKLIGRQAEVTEPITGLRPGRIRIAGEIWSAEPYDETLTIEPGQPVEILQIRGATALVHPIARLGPGG